MFESATRERSRTSTPTTCLAMFVRSMDMIIAILLLWHIERSLQSKTLLVASKDNISQKLSR